MAKTEDSLEKIKRIEEKAKPLSLLVFAIKHNKYKFAELLLTEPYFKDKINLLSLLQAENEIKSKKNSSDDKANILKQNEIELLIAEKKFQLLEEEYEKKNKNLLIEAAKNGMSNVVKYCLEQDKYRNPDLIKEARTAVINSKTTPNSAAILESLNKAEKSLNKDKKSILLEFYETNRRKALKLMLYIKIKNNSISTKDLNDLTNAAKEKKDMKMHNLLVNIKVKLVQERLSELSSNSAPTTGTNVPRRNKNGPSTSIHI